MITAERSSRPTNSPSSSRGGARGRSMRRAARPRGRLQLPQLPRGNVRAAASRRLAPLPRVAPRNSRQAARCGGATLLDVEDSKNSAGYGAVSTAFEKQAGPREVGIWAQQPADAAPRRPLRRAQMVSPARRPHEQPRRVAHRRQQHDASRPTGVSRRAKSSAWSASSRPAARVERMPAAQRDRLDVGRGVQHVGELPRPANGSPHVRRLGRLRRAITPATAPAMAQRRGEHAGKGALQVLADICGARAGPHENEGRRLRGHLRLRDSERGRHRVCRRNRKIHQGGGAGARAASRGQGGEKTSREGCRRTPQ